MTEIVPNIQDAQTERIQALIIRKDFQGDILDLRKKWEIKEIIVQDPDNSRVEQLEQKTDGLEKRVSSLENAVKFLAEKVMSAITTTINLLKELLNKL